MRLPANIEISERSRKFYDGTYKLLGVGFVDEFGSKCSSHECITLTTDTKKSIIDSTNLIPLRARRRHCHR